MATLTKVYDVTPIAQSKDMSCWAAAAAMLLTWRTGISVSEFSAAQQAGATFEYAFNSNSGLLGAAIADFAAALRLVTEAPQNYDPSGYYDLLAAHGPLWVGTAIFSTTQIYRHVRIVRGIDGDGGFDTSILDIVDPDGGRDYQETVTNFARELEQIAIDDLGPDGPGNLYPQIIRFT
jgi:Papain-like cysteine protease AvrRpt2